MKGAQHLKPSFWIEMVSYPDLILVVRATQNLYFLGRLPLAPPPSYNCVRTQRAKWERTSVGSEAHLGLYKDLGSALQHQAYSRANKRWHSYEVGLQASQGDAPLHLLIGSPFRENRSFFVTQTQFNFLICLLGCFTCHLIREGFRGCEVGKIERTWRFASPIQF